jgi:hypothetical protein
VGCKSCKSCVCCRNDAAAEPNSLDATRRFAYRHCVLGGPTPPRDRSSESRFEEAILFPLAATPKAQSLIPYCRSWRCHEQLSPRKLCGEIHSNLAARHCRSAPAPQHQVMGNSDSVIFDRKPLLVDQRSGDVARAHRGGDPSETTKVFRNQHSPARQAHVAMRRPASSRIWASVARFAAASFSAAVTRCACILKKEPKYDNAELAKDFTSILKNNDHERK